VANILVIDDEEDIRDFVGIVLERDGHSVMEASDGNAGMRILEAQPIDVVITDIIMPDKEGIETIIEIRRGNPDLKIIAISGGGRGGGGDYLKVAKQLGADRTFAKPLSAAGLAEAVRDLVA